MIDLSAVIERMAFAAAKDSLPRNGMFNDEQLAVMRDERMPTYRHIAEVMLNAALASWLK